MNSEPFDGRDTRFVGEKRNRKVILELTYRVYGRIRRTDNGQGIPNLRVRAYDIDWISSDDYLGHDVTDANGNFEIRFERDDFDAGWFDPEGGPDIVLKVYSSAGRMVYRSPEKSGAGEKTYIAVSLDPLDLIGQYTVSGRVLDARSNRELCNLRVEAWDDDLFFDDYLGNAKTDRTGNYQIVYDEDAFKGWWEGRPDPYLKVKNDAGNLLARSFTRSEAPHHSNIDAFVGGVELSRSMAECIYAWTAAYRQEGTHIVVRIQLNPDANVTAAQLQNLRNTWKTGIENKWSNRFACCCEMLATSTLTSSNWAPLTFEVQWVTANPHHTVRVRVGPAGSNMLLWDTSDSADVASHEFGHMLGLVDEYTSALCPGRTPVNTGTVMDDNTEVVEGHVEDLCRFINENAVPIITLVLWPVPMPVPPPEKKDRPPPEKEAERDSAKMEIREKLLEKLILVIDNEGALDKEDRIVLGVSGGPFGQRLDSLIEVMGDGAVRYNVRDMLAGLDKEYSDNLDKKTLVNLLTEIKETGLLKLGEKHEGFLPDSLIGFVTIKIGESETTFYYLADKEQRLHQGKAVPQAVALVSSALKRVGERAVKRDKALQKKITKKLEEKKSKD